MNRSGTMAPILPDAQDCGWTHQHDDPVFYALATKMAAVYCQTRTPTDEQIGWWLDAADAIVDDFKPPPERWRLRKLPDTDEFEARFRLNDVTYVLQEGGKGEVAQPVRLSTLRAWDRETGGAS
jgi:hypothetical protein